MFNEIIGMMLALNASTVHLTFDDGPHHEYTHQVLTILKENNIKANFFLIGENIKAHPEIVDEIVADGHDIGGHSMTHKQLTKLPIETAKYEIMESMRLVNQHQRSDLFRFPYGSFSPALVNFVHSKGFVNIYWDVDTTDWKYKDKDIIYEKFKIRFAKSKDGSIVLMHDVHPQSVAALRMIVKYLNDNNIKTKKLEEK